MFTLHILVVSSAAALVTQYLTTAMAKQRLVQNSGYLRIMVIETSNGKHSIYRTAHCFNIGLLLV